MTRDELKRRCDADAERVASDKWTAEHKADFSRELFTFATSGQMKLREPLESCPMVGRLDAWLKARQ